MVKQYAFYYNTDACTGCKTCVGACKDIHDAYVGLKHRRVIDFAGGSWNTSGAFPVSSGVFAYSVSISCMHCQNPICVKVCPTGAMQKRDDGIVWVDQTRCVGCKYCSMACPYGAPRIDERTKTMSKCDFCKGLIDSGEDPACVAGCPMRAIEYGELADLQRKYGTTNTIAPLPDGSYTNPSVVIGVSRWAKDASAGIITNPKEELI